MRIAFLKLSSFFASVLICFSALSGCSRSQSYTAARPQGMSRYSEKTAAYVKNADFYVSSAGDDLNSGSFDAPFASISRARDAIRELDKNGRSGITVAVMSGEYRISSLEFTSADSGTASCPIIYTAYGDGEVILNGGVTLDAALFSPVTDASVASRLSNDAKTNVRYINLASLNIGADDYGKIYAIGSYHTAE